MANNSSIFGSGGADSITMSRSSQVLRSSMMLESSVPGYQSQGRDSCCTRCWNSSAMKVVQHVLKKAIRSVVWRALMITFSIYLLFGSQIRHLFIPSSLDATLDIISLVVFGFFIVDMIIRVIIFPTYFSIGCCKNTSGASGGNDVQTGVVFGSFVFWCDLVSTITLLYDISWINKKQYCAREVEIQLNEFGHPVSTYRYG